MIVLGPALPTLDSTTANPSACANVAWPQALLWAMNQSIGGASDSCKLSAFSVTHGSMDFGICGLSRDCIRACRGLWGATWPVQYFILSRKAVLILSIMQKWHESNLFCGLGILFTSRLDFENKVWQVQPEWEVLHNGPQANVWFCILAWQFSWNATCPGTFFCGHSVEHLLKLHASLVWAQSHFGSLISVLYRSFWPEHFLLLSRTVLEYQCARRKPRTREICGSRDRNGPSRSSTGEKSYRWARAGSLGISWTKTIPGCRWPHAPEQFLI